jgi:Ni/Co efflux regulator RcnB
MVQRATLAVTWLAALLLAGAAGAQERHYDEHPMEPHPGPSGYQRIAEPHGWDARPREFDRAAYQHNFQAARVYHIGPYVRPVGWVDRRWGFGMILPRGYFAAPYIVADYWLFALEVPPVGFEWVRVGPDAMLVNVTNGEILQAEYGVFG